MKAKFVYFVAPTCTGKGFILKLMERLLQVVLSIGSIRVSIVSFGDIIKDLLKTDPAFGERYGESVRKGNLIDDPTAIRLFRGKVDELMSSANPPDFIFVDGFGRSTPQIAYAANNGFIDDSSIVFMISASLQVCLDRFLHRKANAARVDAEVETFHKRYHLHMDATPDLRAMFKETACRLIEIDGNPSIAEHVFPAIAGHLLPEFARVASARVESHADDVRD